MYTLESLGLVRDWNKTVNSVHAQCLDSVPGLPRYIRRYIAHTSREGSSNGTLPQPQSMPTRRSVRRSYRRVINTRSSVVYSSLASCLFSSQKLSNGEAVTRRRATSCLPLVYPHVMYHPRPCTFPQFPTPTWQHN